MFSMAVSSFNKGSVAWKVQAVNPQVNREINLNVKHVCMSFDVLYQM
nr:MAG TPA: hypothetical protein [Caudoviricetes sp.]